MPARARADRRQQRRDDEHRYKLATLREYIAKNGWDGLRRGTVYRGVNLYSWVHNRRTEYKTGEVRDFLVPELERIPGWSWDAWRDHMRDIVDDLRGFVRVNGWEALTVDTALNGVKLSGWCAVRRREHRNGKLAVWLVSALEAIPGWSWEPREDHYEARIEQLRVHVARDGWEGFGIATIDRAGNRIGKWANHIRVLQRRGGLPTWVADELNAIAGWSWEPRREKRAMRKAIASVRKSRSLR